MLADEAGSGIIVRDANTYELLYTNKAACERLQVELSDYTGQKCHEFFNHTSSPCPFCKAAMYHKGRLIDEKLYVFDYDKHFLRICSF